MDLYVGWDVGGWNCDQNRNSQDALCALTGGWADLHLEGNPWRGNLREALVAEDDILPAILGKIGIDLTNVQSVTWAIDTPLGWPDAFRGLIIHNGGWVHVPPGARDNPYLFRETERCLFRKGFHPLSPVKDRIGSQSTKGIRFLTRFGFALQNVGVWAAGGHTAIETYPTPVRESPRVRPVFARLQNILHQQPAAAGIDAWKDVEDSLWWALVAALFALHQNTLYAPGPDVPPEEGWIWIPTDCAGVQRA
jgi:hypothetical protein